MSWLFKSLQFQSEESDSSAQPEQQQDDGEGSPSNRGGMKEDLSVISETIGRQLRGVAAFLAPPPSLLPSEQEGEQPQESSRQALLGIRDDLAEIGGSFKSGLSLLSSNKAVTGISKFASDLLQFQIQEEEEEDGDDDYVPGVTDEVIEFVKEISVRPECWTDFPLPLDDNGFRMSDAQREHVSAVESLVPSFTALRINLQRFMGEEQFWIIYFILLLPRLNEHDFELLSSPEIVETRNILLQNIKNKRNAEAVSSGDSRNLTSLEDTKEGETQQHIGSEERELVEIVEEGESQQRIDSEEKELVEIVSGTERVEIDNQGKSGERLEEAATYSGTGINVVKKLEYDEDVSFSDLEDDENDLPTRSSALRPVQGTSSSPTRSSDWVQLNERSGALREVQKGSCSTSEDKDSEDAANDWLTVDDFD
ncbi:hypothetical protein HS088_TW09G00051 [Tripterygium wilfordii]|uniref:BSD domain-containing protein n=1 Tax=Tripterygium wilfordii TaxID=458696 RepID=A0A7J7D6Q7_TRIWF|nr:uncharacterized protein LOC120004795 [Tripterygium wilfordii]KAF5742012.1 hypothetical protein HS088_TW09G00051 [Tripterygium wilfordii]